ncbi:MAG: hypothetical protein WCT08_02980 [Patescibacteria group bacterium]|jgi:hypothetical protein
MESEINLLPEKDKQLKREAKPKAPEIEMTQPKDRVFSEHVVPASGLVEFFKNLFGKKDQLIIKKGHEKLEPPEPKKSVLTPAAPIGPVTRIEAMASRVTMPPPPPVPVQLKPQSQNQAKSTATSAKPGFFHKFLNKIEGIPEKPAPKPSKNIEDKNILPSRPTQPPPQQPEYRPETPLPARKPVWTPPPPPAVMVNAPESQASTLNKLPPVPLPPRKPVTDSGEAVREVTKGKQRPEPSPVMGLGLNVNLVPEEYQTKTGPKLKVYFALTILIPILIIAGMSFGLWIYTKNVQNKISKINDELQLVKTQIESITTGTLTYAQALQQKTSSLNTVLNQHVYWDKFFMYLEKYTLPSVSYQNMSVDITGGVSLSATTKTFDDVGRELLILKQAADFVNEVTITSAVKASIANPLAANPPDQKVEQKTEEVVNFSIALKVKPEIFFKRSK